MCSYFHVEMLMVGNVEDAEHRLDELVTRAATEGPQMFRHGETNVVILIESTFRSLIEHKPTLKELLINGPFLEGVDIGRDTSPARSAEF